jgi:hypothetical protein
VPRSIQADTGFNLGLSESGPANRQLDVSQVLQLEEQQFFSEAQSASQHYAIQQAHFCVMAQR